MTATSTASLQSIDEPEPAQPLGWLQLCNDLQPDAADPAAAPAGGG